MPEGTPPSLDGITPASAPAAAPSVPASPNVAAVAKPKTAGINRLLIGVVVFAVLFLMPALLLMVIFPTPDDSLGGIKLVGMAVYGGALLLALGLGLVGMLRISGIKDKPRMRRMAMLRLLAGTIPVALVSGLVLFVISQPTQLSLDIVSPQTSNELLAPLTVTFGLDSANKIFARQNLQPLKYEWDVGNDGTVDQETFDPQATFLFQKPGIYTVVARVLMTNNIRKTVSRRLVIPRTSFGVEPDYPVIDEAASFTLEHLFPASTDPKIPKLTKAKWDFDGDGNVDLETDKLTASFTYRKLGPINGSVVLTLNNQAQQTLQRIVEVVKPPVQPFPITLETEPSTLLGPPPFGALFILKTDEPIASVTWSFGDQKSGEGLRVAHVYNTIGNYTATVLVRSQSGATAKMSRVVRITNPLQIPDLTFEGKPAVQSFTIEGEVPLSVNLTPITALPLISFSWDAPGASGVTTSDKTVSAVYREEGKYFLDLIGVDPEQNVLRKRISVNVKPASSLVQFSMDPPTPTAPALVKFDASDTFISQGQEITGFEWDFGDGFSSSDKTKFSGSRIEHLYQKPGTYIITLNARTTAGNVFTGKQQLVVKAPLIDACFIPSRTNGKAPLGVRFDSSCSTGQFVSWLWDFADGSQSDQQNPTHVFLKAGEYKVVLSATDKDGLKSNKEAIISVSPDTP